METKKDKKLNVCSPNLKDSTQDERNGFVKILETYFPVLTKEENNNENEN